MNKSKGKGKSKSRSKGAAKPEGKFAAGGLQVVRAKVAGVDIGSRSMQVCGPVGADEQREVQTFGTTTPEIDACIRWMKERRVESVAMESTGVYWVPVLERMEAQGLETVLVDPRPMSRVPGRKTDVIDCCWLQTMHSHGLAQGSFLPSEEISQLIADIGKALDG